jgi:S1-C subfamily serine protease
MINAARFTIFLTLCLGTNFKAQADDFSAIEDPTTTIQAEIESPKIIKSSNTVVKKHQKISRNSAVKVITMNGGHGSGTYVKFKNHYLIITAGHVVDNGPIYAVEGGGGEVVLGQLIYRSKNSDIGILKVPSMNSRKHINFKATENSELKIGDEVVYSGFPSSYDLLTSAGLISGQEESYNAVILQGFAWPGSSGAGVIDNSGKIRGVIVAVGVERFAGLQILETLVYIHTLKETDIEAVKEILRSP